MLAFPSIGTSVPQPAPDDLDYAMLKAAMEFSQQIYATHGGMPPVAMVQLPPQPDGKIMHMVMPCDKMTTADEKRRFIQSVHYAELEHNGHRSCWRRSGLEADPYPSIPMLLK